MSEALSESSWIQPLNLHPESSDNARAEASVVSEVSHFHNWNGTPRMLRKARNPASAVGSSTKQRPTCNMLNQSDVQTEDGHAMMKFDTFHSFRNLSHAVRGCHETVIKCAPTCKLVRVTGDQ